MLSCEHCCQLLPGKKVVNAGMQEKSQSGIGISSGSQLPQFGIGIPASRAS
jgi:hypothetical protein